MNKLFACLLLFATTLFAEPTLTIGTTTGYAPYVSLNSAGEPEGFDIDFANLLAKKLNRKLVIKDLGSMPSLMIALKQKKVDALIWAISITEERSQQMEMIYYQGEKLTTMPLVFWNKLPPNITGPQDLDAKTTVCVEAGSYQEQVMRTYPNLNLKNVDKITDAILEIKFGKSVAIAMDNSLVPTAKKQSPELQTLYFPLPPSMQSLGNGVCVDKSNPKLAAEIQKAVDELISEGKIQELEKKWNLSN